jgi:hypothetical protein
MDFQKALDIHKELFPMASVHSQLLQFNEEKEEYERAKIRNARRKEYNK